MAENTPSYPYVSYTQILGVRNKLRSSIPKTIDLDWIIAACSLQEKAARNLLAQIRVLGIVDDEGSPTELAHDLRDDATFKAATQQIVEAVYPQSLRDTHGDPTATTPSVAPWFMRNAKTGEATARMQASLYLGLLRADLPSQDGAKPGRAPRAPKAQPVKATTAAKQAVSITPEEPLMNQNGASDGTDRSAAFGPNLHIDLQIHISSEASESQIEAVFKSMAKHLYGR